MIMDARTLEQGDNDRPEKSSSGVVRNIWERFQDWISRSGKRPKIGLALGSGAAWGVAHIGVLSVLEELKIPISYLSGSSSGSFVGALYAGGVQGKELEACGLSYGWRDAGKLNYVPKMGLASNIRMASYLQKRIGNPDFKDLRLPFYVVATNLTKGRLRIFNEGAVIPAVRASCALPGIFEPVEIDGEPYCDGGILNRLPYDILRKEGADLVIGVELSTSLEKKPTDIFEVINRSFDIARFSQAKTDSQEADLIIRPNVAGISEFAFNRNAVLIDRGREAAFDQLKNWRELQAATEPQAEQAG
jgi:NTE family protein